MGFSPDYGFSPVGSGFSDFGRENPPTDPPVTGSGGGEPPPTVTGVGSDGFRAGSDGFFGWVGCRVSVDSPIIRLLAKFEDP